MLWYTILMNWWQIYEEWTSDNSTPGIVGFFIGTGIGLAVIIWVLSMTFFS